MAGVRDSLGVFGRTRLAEALGSCGGEGFTGELKVTGAPGGAFHLRDGLVVAAESPGAPGAEALLLRTGRVDAEQWAELVRETGGERWPAAALVARGLAGAAELRVLCVMALQDAAFAIIAGRVDDCERAPVAGPPPAAVTLGEPPARLLQDAARKLTALDALPYPVRPDRERPVPGTLPQSRLSAFQGELLAHADGRRTTRDLAFRTGRGVYAVTVEVAWMLALGFLKCAAEPAPIPVRLPADSVVRRHVPAPPVPAPAAPGPAPAAPTALPRRTPGASGITEALTPQQSGASWKGFLRLWSADRNRVPQQPGHHDQQLEN
ncbi:MarR family transcriptional regulator [Streptomyces sp. NPDC093094]|uniref:MarR family transcriptional regulator n=1 Tax=Streptomyces sp. NPDC093094 TaxID=3366026 RepID=UPI003809C303